MTKRELIEKLLDLQITQTATLTRLLEANIERTRHAEQQAPNRRTEDEEDRPLRIGDTVTLLTPGRFRVLEVYLCGRRETPGIARERLGISLRRRVT
jgi:hypothetical protein